jgi:hypothetical protein
VRHLQLLAQQDLLEALVTLVPQEQQAQQVRHLPQQDLLALQDPQVRQVQHQLWLVQLALLALKELLALLVPLAQQEQLQQ